MRTILLAMSFIALSSAPVQALDTIAVYGDTGSGLSRYIDTQAGAPFDLVVLQKSELGATAVEFTMTEIAQLDPGILKINTVKPNDTPLDLGDNAQGEYLMALLGCVFPPPIEHVRVTYLDLVAALEDNIVVGIDGILPTSQYPSTFDGDPGFIDCSSSYSKHVLSPEGPAFLTGSGVLVPAGAAVLNPTLPVLPIDPDSYFALDFDPDTFNLKSQGHRVSAFLSPLGDVGIEEIDPNSLRLNGVAPIPGSVKISGYDGMAMLGAQFDRGDVAATLETGDEVMVRVMGSLVDGTPFQADDLIRVIEPGNHGDMLATKFGATASPNPFNPSTTITYRLPDDGYAELVIYDLSGRRVKTLVAGSRRAGEYQSTWNGHDESGRRVASGVYLYQLRSGAQVENHRLVLVK